MADDSTSTLTWSGNLDISQANSVHDELMGALDLNQPILLDAEGVNRVDTSLSELDQSIARFRDGWRDVVHKPATQEDMGEGEVELF